MIRTLILIIVLASPINLHRGDLSVTLCQPGTYYQGTRFDWSGVFRSVEYEGESFCDEWFDEPDPLRNDNVCGPSEEFFGCQGYEEASVGETFLKLGVGLLRKDSDEPYDWLHTYEIADGGRRSVFRTGRKAVFRHIMPGRYRYVKTIKLTGNDTFVIMHKMKNTSKGTLSFRQYCHNFFTFGLPNVGPERMVEWNASFEGTWREDNVNAEKDARRIWMNTPMQKGQKSYIGDLTVTEPQPDGYGFTLSAGEKVVEVKSNAPMDKSVFWSNHRVFCPEPYVNFSIESGKTAVWWIEYRLGKKAVDLCE